MSKSKQPTSTADRYDVYVVVDTPTRRARRNPTGHASWRLGRTRTAEASMPSFGRSR